MRIASRLAIIVGLALLPTVVLNAPSKVSLPPLRSIELTLELYTPLKISPPDAAFQVWAAPVPANPFALIILTGSRRPLVAPDARQYERNRHGEKDERAHHGECQVRIACAGETPGRYHQPEGEHRQRQIDRAMQLAGRRAIVIDGALHGGLLGETQE